MKDDYLNIPTIEMSPPWDGRPCLMGKLDQNMADDLRRRIKETEENIDKTLAEIDRSDRDAFTIFDYIAMISVLVILPVGLGGWGIYYLFSRFFLG